MKQCLVDVNVLLALLVTQHQHHEIVRAWAEDLAPAEVGVCRHVQLAVIRLLGNSAVMGPYAMSASAAWDMIEEQLLADERFEFVAEPSVSRFGMRELLRYPGPTGKLVGDAYLAAFAIATARQLVTLDGGFRQFQGLYLRLLRSN